ncbi:MAG TPA: phosphopantetheine-binding protein, partial [Micromonospora sp.]
MNTVRVDESLASVEDKRDLLRDADPETRRELLRAYVRQLCSEVLTEWSPDTADDEELFFESIAAAEFKAVIERDLDVTIPFTDLVEEPTVAGLAELFAACLDEALTAGPGAGASDSSGVGMVVPDVAGRFEAFGLTDVQHAYWLGRAGLFELGGVSAHLYAEFESGGFDVGRASWAFQRLVQRHDMLRAVVRSDGRQQVLESVPAFEVELEDLSGLSSADAEAR